MKHIQFSFILLCTSTLFYHNIFAPDRCITYGDSANTCYITTSIHILSNLRHFRNFLDNNQEVINNDQLLNNLHNIFQNLKFDTETLHEWRSKLRQQPDVLFDPNTKLTIPAWQKSPLIFQTPQFYTDVQYTFFDGNGGQQDFGEFFNKLYEHLKTITPNKHPLTISSHDQNLFSWSGKPVISASLQDFQNLNNYLQRLNVETPPQIIIISLARYNDDFSFSTDNITIRPELTIENINYTLKGLGIYSGTGLVGHYTSVVQDLDNNKWYHYSDTYYARITPEDLATLFERGIFIDRRWGPKIESYSYERYPTIFFYEKQEISPLIQQLSALKNSLILLKIKLLILAQKLKQLSLIL